MKKVRSTLFTTLATAIIVFILPSLSQAMHASESPEIVLAGGTNYSITLRGSLGALNGESRELVYDFDLGYRRKTSELIWDLKDLYMLGGIVSANVYNWFNVNLGIWTAFNQGNGGMLDYDWIPNTPGAPSLDAWTHRSISDVMVTSAQMFDLNASSFPLKWKDFSFRAIIGYKYDSWTWDDKAYDYVYSQRSYHDTVGSFNGQNVIDYEQTFAIPYVGVNADGSLGPVKVDAYFLYSSSVTAEDKDHHILRGIHFKESFSGGTYVALGLKGTYQINKSMFVSAGIDYQSIPEIAGDMELSSLLGGTQSAVNVAGIEHSSTMLSASFGYTFD